MHKEKKLFIAIAIVTVVIIIGSCMAIAMGHSIQEYAGDINNLPYFHETNCTPVTVQTTYMFHCKEVDGPDGGTSYTSKWIALWGDKKGFTILEDPFSGKSSQQLADNDKDDYPLNVMQPCMCNTPPGYPDIGIIKNCQVWTTCFFDVDMIKERQLNAASDYNKGAKIMAGGGIVLGVYVLIVFFGICSSCQKQGYTNPDEPLGPV